MLVLCALLVLASINKHMSIVISFAKLLYSAVSKGRYCWL